MNFCVLALQNEIDSKSLFYILYYILFYICVYIHKTETVSLCFTYLVTQSCPTLCDPVDYIAHQAPLSVGIFQARILRVGCHALLYAEFSKIWSYLDLCNSLFCDLIHSPHHHCDLTPPKYNTWTWCPLMAKALWCTFHTLYLALSCPSGHSPSVSSFVNHHYFKFLRVVYWNIKKTFIIKYVSSTVSLK